MGKALPYKIVDSSGQNRYGIVVSSLQGLKNKAHAKFGVAPSIMKIVLEIDGTEVDEEEYFSTLEQNTCFMILKQDEDWIPPSQYNYFKKYVGDEVDNCNSSDLVHLLGRIRNDAGQLSMLGGKELELLSDMDPDSLSDIIQDKEFLGEVKEASSRFLNDRRDAKEALKLLKIYHAATNNMIGRGYSNVGPTGNSANETVQ